jgi:hypothetical protein
MMFDLWIPSEENLETAIENETVNNVAAHSTTDAI